MNPPFLVQRGLKLTIVCGLCLFATVSADPGQRIRTLPVPGGGEPLAAQTGPDGTIHLLFHDAGGPQYIRSRDNGDSFSAPIAVVDQGALQPGLTFEVWDMAVGPDGRIHVALGTNAWKLKLPKTEWGFFYARLDPDKSVFTPVRNINRTPSEGFSLAVSDQGRVTACWLADQLFVNVSDDHGDTFSATVELDPQVNPCNCCTTSATYGTDGRLAVLYREETNNARDMFLILWDQATQKISRTAVSHTLWKINACPMTYYDVSRDGNGFVAVWPTKGDVYFTRLDAAGVPKAPAEIRTTGTTGTRTGILALAAADGSSMIVWKKNERTLTWQLYDPKGQPSAPPSSAESAGKGVAGVVSRDGRFLLFR